MINRMLFKNLFMLLAVNFCLHSQAQVFPPKNYPKGYFSWPVDAVKGIVANFGELRPNHYHMGLDCRTDQVENRPVLAAADGYIAKVKIERYGFGRCIYINHPNGLTTLYAHLNTFNPALEKYITDQQYRLESWAVFLDIPADLFPVKKGDFIAYSGNTGGSQGPHVHFEIRDTKTDKVLNPLLFGMPINDNIAPDIYRLAIYDRSKSTYEQIPRLIAVKKVAGKYTTVPALVVANTDKVSFSITAFDRYTGSTNKNGIYEGVLYEDGNAIVGFQLDSISYDETRYLNAHIDYKLRSSGGSFMQHLSRLPGYPKNGVYTDFSGDGVIDISDKAVHDISINIKDAAGNSSVLEFKVQSSKKDDVLPAMIKPVFQPNMFNVFENDKVSFYMGEKQLYDSFTFRYAELMPASAFPIYQLQNGLVPVQTYFPVSIKSNTNNPDKIMMRQSANGKTNYSKVLNQNGWFRASFRSFGSFQLVEDVQPPVVTPVGFRNGINASKLSRIAFVITDNTEELQNFRAELDGKWLRFSNDKGKVFIYKFDEHCPPGEHELKISVEDFVGNRTERTYHFTR